jgi:hypothetical protein
MKKDKNIIKNGTSPNINGGSSNGSINDQDEKHASSRSQKS